MRLGVKVFEFGGAAGGLAELAGEAWFGRTSIHVDLALGMLRSIFVRNYRIVLGGCTENTGTGTRQFLILC